MSLVFISLVWFSLWRQVICFWIRACDVDVKSHLSHWKLVPSWNEAVWLWRSVFDIAFTSHCLHWYSSTSWCDAICLWMRVFDDDMKSHCSHNIFWVFLILLSRASSIISWVFKENSSVLSSLMSFSSTSSSLVSLLLFYFDSDYSLNKWEEVIADWVENWTVQFLNAFSSGFRPENTEKILEISCLVFNYFIWFLTCFTLSIVERMVTSGLAQQFKAPNKGGRSKL